MQDPLSRNRLPASTPPPHPASRPPHPLQYTHFPNLLLSFPHLDFLSISRMIQCLYNDAHFMRNLSKSDIHVSRAVNRFRLSLINIDYHGN